MYFIRNTILVFASLIIALLLTEIITRLVLGAPIEITNRTRIHDDNFGYKVNSNLEGVDSFGFRNDRLKYLNYEIVTIGDSHTWGYNVESKNSWPLIVEKLKKTSVYNMGIGGNGIYSYHYLIKNELKKGKKVILGLYLPNDFERKGYVCSINFKNRFWSEEIERLQLNPPKCSKSLKKNSDLSSFRSYLKTIQLKSSLLTFIKYEIYIGLQSYLLKIRSEYLFINKQFQPITFSKLKAQSKLTDISVTSTKYSLEDFKKMLYDWKESSNEKQFGIILIPSNQLVYRLITENLKDKKKFINLDILKNYTNNEIIFEQQLIQYFQDLNIPIRSASTQLVKLFIDNFPKKEIENFYPDGGHPGVLGHKAYALSAIEVLNEIENFNK